jgi:hypothetical protein
MTTRLTMKRSRDHPEREVDTPAHARFQMRWRMSPFDLWVSCRYFTRTGNVRAARREFRARSWKNLRARPTTSARDRSCTTARLRSVCSIRRTAAIARRGLAPADRRATDWCLRSVGAATRPSRVAVWLRRRIAGLVVGDQGAGLGAGWVSERCGAASLQVAPTSAWTDGASPEQARTRERHAAAPFHSDTLHSLRRIPGCPGRLVLKAQRPLRRGLGSPLSAPAHAGDTRGVHPEASPAGARAVIAGETG